MSLDAIVRRVYHAPNSKVHCCRKTCVTYILSTFDGVFPGCGFSHVFFEFHEWKSSLPETISPQNKFAKFIHKMYPWMRATSESKIFNAWPLKRPLTNTPKLFSLNYVKALSEMITQTRSTDTAWLCVWKRKKGISHCSNTSLPTDECVFKRVVVEKILWRTN